MGFEEKLTYYVEKMAPTCRENDSISDELFTKYGVYRGLRDLNRFRERRRRKKNSL